MSQRQALPMEDDSEESNDDFDMDKDSAASYLKKVRSQRNKIPQIVTIQPNISKMDDTEPITIHKSKRCSKDPTKEWQQIQAEKFRNIQDKIDKLRNNPKFQKEVTAHPEVEISPEFCKENEPKLSTVISLHQGYVETLIEEIVADFNENLEDLKVEEIQSFLWIPKWFYALLACLRLPLDPDVVSNLRIIAKNCQTVKESLKSQEEINFNPDQLLPFDLIIGIVNLNFNQFDL